MSKATVRKTIAEFDAPQLRELILDVYSKSKEAKELLDFFANPDIAAKIEEYKKPLYKEVHRFTRHAHHPRMPKIKTILKKFAKLEPGDEAIAELRVYVVLEFCDVGYDTALSTKIVDAVDSFFTDTLKFLRERTMLDEYRPRLKKKIESMKDHLFYKNQLKKTLIYTLNHFDDDEEK